MRTHECGSLRKRRDIRKMNPVPERLPGRDYHMSQEQACLARRMAIGATVLVTCLGPQSVARAVPTLSLRFEHSGRETGTALWDRVRLRAGGFTWSDGTVDLLWEPAPRVASPESYIVDADHRIAFDLLHGESVWRFSEDIYNTMMPPTDTTEAVARTGPIQPPTAAKTSPAGTTTHITEAVSEPTVWNLDPRP
jgi:hypothetical protein